jgi:hypothetical protein
MEHASSRQQQGSQLHMIVGKVYHGGLLVSYMDYYNGARTHLSLNKDAPLTRAVPAAGAFGRRIMGERFDEACLSNPANPNEQDRISRFVHSDWRRQLKRLQTRFQTL